MLIPCNSRRMAGIFRYRHPQTVVQSVGGCFHPRPHTMRRGSILVRRHIGMLAPHAPPAGRTAIHLHFVAPHFRLRLWGNISVADLLDMNQFHFLTAAGTLRCGHAHPFRRWRWRRTGWRRGLPIPKWSLPRLTPRPLGILLFPPLPPPPLRSSSGRSELFTQALDLGFGSFQLRFGALQLLFPPAQLFAQIPDLSLQFLDPLETTLAPMLHSKLR